MDALVSAGLQAGSATMRSEMTVLVVDDEPLVLNFIAAFLQHTGYQVLKAETATQALELFQAQYGQIDLVLVDLMLPDMPGIKLLPALVNIDPQVKVIFSSGMSEELLSRAAKHPNAHAWLQKPFHGEHLAAVVGQVLNQAASVQ